MKTQRNQVETPCRSSRQVVNASSSQDGVSAGPRVVVSAGGAGVAAEVVVIGGMVVIGVIVVVVIIGVSSPCV